MAWRSPSARHLLVVLLLCLGLGLPFLVPSVEGKGNHPTDPSEIYKEAYAAFHRRDFDTSITLFKKLLKLAPNVMDLYAAYGTVLESAGKYKDAKELYKQAGWKFPSSIEPSRLLCRALFNEFQMDVDNRALKDETEKICERVAEKGDTATDHMVLGNFYLDTNRPRRALGHLEKAVALASQETGFQYRRNLMRAYSIGLLRNARCKESLALSRSLIEESPGVKELQCNLGHILTVCEPRSWESFTSMRLCSTCNDQVGRCELDVPDQAKCGGETRYLNCGGDWESCHSDHLQVTLVPTDLSLHYGSNETLSLRPLAVPIPLAYHARKIFLLTFEDVYMFSEGGRIFTDCHVFSTVQSFNAKVPHTIAHARKTIEVETPVISLISQTMENYYHFMAEGMSRFFLARKYLPGAVDRLPFLIPEGNRFIDQIIKLFHLEDRVIRYGAHSDHRHHFKEVHYVDWYQPYRGEIHEIDGWAVYQPPREGLMAVREGFLPLVTRPVPEKPEIVVVSRGDTAGLRAITNEDDMLMRLEEEFPDYRINKFVATGVPLIDQIGTFSQAALVLGPHGAGLTNIMFCRPGTPILYFPVEPSVDSNFGHISSAVGLDFWIVPSASAPFFGQYTFGEDVLGDIMATARAAFRRQAERQPIITSRSEL